MHVCMYVCMYVYRQLSLPLLRDANGQTPSRKTQTRELPTMSVCAGKPDAAAHGCDTVCTCVAALDTGRTPFH